MSSRELEYTIVDAFTQSLFGGNPAAVIVLQDDDDIPDTTKQLLGREFNLSETAFVAKTSDPNAYGIRWFTPVKEYPICGHATLASSHVVLPPGEARTITFKTRWAGDLTVSRTTKGLLEMTFPAGVATPASEDLLQRTRDAVAAAFPALTVDSVKTVVVGQKGTPYEKYLLIDIQDDADIGNLVVKPSELIVLAPFELITITNAAPENLKSEGVHFVSRAFAPLGGIDEDPVCGSAHCVLAPFWTSKLGAAGQSLTGKQLSPRVGDLEVEWVESENVVKLRGHATTVAKGTIRVPS